MPFGATLDEWTHFATLLGLTSDLLPVVSNPTARPSPRSKLKALGKVPSLYGTDGVYGVGAWTSKVSDAAEVAQWSAQPDYGICIQTREVRAIDVDIGDAELAAQIDAHIPQHLPRRRRSNSPKFLVAFRLPGEYAKRVIKTPHGAIEFLANGQQFIAAGTHPSGARYEWTGGLPDDIPTLTADQFEDLCHRLAHLFGTDQTTSTPSTKAAVLAGAALSDPVAQRLLAEGWVKSTERDGRLHIRCPFEQDHEVEPSESSTTYFPAHTGGYANGHFHCFHAPCAHHTDDEFRLAVGMDDFALVDTTADPDKPERFTPRPVRSLTSDTLSSAYHIKGVLDRAELAFIYGESTAGKTFVALDFAYHIAVGQPWRGRRVTPGRVWYVCCEGVGGFGRRLAALCQRHGIDDIPNFQTVTDTPSLLNTDYKALAAMVTKHGGADVIFIDTWSRAIAGGDENSAEVVTKAIAHASALHKLTTATVVLVAHAGKDTTKGIRGHSSTKGSADVQIEVRREGEADAVQRSVRLEKVKDGDGEGLEFGFALDTVSLGTDQDGDTVTSCVVRAASVQPAKRALGAVEKLALGVVREGITDGTGMPAAVVQELVFGMLAVPGDGKRDRRRDVIVRALNALVADGLLAIENQIYTLKGAI